MINFINSSTLAEWAKTPAWSGDGLAEVLISVVSEWIREHKPDVADDDRAAQLVTFEVARDALLLGEFGSVASSFSKTVGQRARSATIDRAAVEKFITDRHKRMLSILVGVRPAYRFGD